MCLAVFIPWEPVNKGMALLGKWGGQNSQTKSNSYQIDFNLNQITTNSSNSGGEIWIYM